MKTGHLVSQFTGHANTRYIIRPAFINRNQFVMGGEDGRLFLYCLQSPGDPVKIVDCLASDDAALNMACIDHGLIAVSGLKNTRIKLINIH